MPADTSPTSTRRSRTVSTFRSTAAPGVVDLHHLNALQRIEDGTGDYLLTARHLDAAFRVDRATKNIDWFVGGAHAPCTPPGVTTNCRLSTVGDPLRWTEAPARCPTQRQRADDDGQPRRNGPAVPGGRLPHRRRAVRRRCSGRSRRPSGLSGGTLGSVRVQPDGSILVGWGAPLQPMFTEYDANRNLTMAITKTPSRFLVPDRQVPGHRLRRHPTPRHRRRHRPRPPVDPPPPVRKMEQMSRSARHLLHISEVGGASGVDFSKLSPDLLSLVPHRLVEADDMPPDLAAGSITGVVTALASITSVPPRRAGFHAETNARPCDVDVDGLASPQSDRILANGNRETGFVDRAEDIVFESALRWSLLRERTLEPSLHRRDAVLASAAMSLEVAGRSPRESPGRGATHPPPHVRTGTG